MTYKPDIAYTHGNRPKEIKESAQGGPVAQWIFDGFEEKSPADTGAQITVRLPEIRVVSTQPDGCVSAIQYLEAQRQKAIGPDTIRRLDPQLRKMNPEILKLRPRFAPP